MRPIATILLDTPDSQGPVRGVVSMEDGRLVVYDPRDGEREYDGQTEGIATITAALDAAERLWGGSGWDLRWLCEDAEDYIEDPSR
jgi:hypothetical protein